MIDWKKCLLGGFLIATLPLWIYGQDSLTQQSEALKWSETIDSNDMKRHLFYLASDHLEGRETGSTGNDRAAQYAADFFRKLGYLPVDEDRDYFQEITFTRFNPSNYVLRSGSQSLKHFEDFVVSPFNQKPLYDSTIEKLHFAGYGIQSSTYSDFGEWDWEGKHILIFENIPPEIKKLVPDSTLLELKSRLLASQKKGVRSVFIISDRFNSTASKVKRYLISGKLNLGEVNPDSLPLPPHVHVNIQVAKALIGKKQKAFIEARKKRIRDRGLMGKPLQIPTDLIAHWHPDLEFIQSQNVAAYLSPDGSTKGEHVVVSAHYDHLGTRAGEVYNGADDNASGTTSLLELAETYAEAIRGGIRPERSVLFILMTGEEKGLLGSKYYSEHPLLPMEKAVANVNIDMVGRIDKKYEDSVSYIYVIGADRISQELHDINELANRVGPQLALDYTYNEEDDPNRYYYRSDHYNFAKKGIPVIFYFNGTHEDYHRITDTAGKIRYAEMKKRAELFFLTLWELTHRPDRLKIMNPTK